MIFTGEVVSQIVFKNLFFGNAEKKYLGGGVRGSTLLLCYAYNIKLYDCADI